MMQDREDLRVDACCFIAELADRRAENLKKCRDAKAAGDEDAASEYLKAAGRCNLEMSGALRLISFLRIFED